MRAARGLRRTVTKNIEAILKLEEDDERQLSPLHRVSHKVGGSQGPSTLSFARPLSCSFGFWEWERDATIRSVPLPIPVRSLSA